MQFIKSKYFNKFYAFQKSKALNIHNYWKFQNLKRQPFLSWNFESKYDEWSLILIWWKIFCLISLSHQNFNSFFDIIWGFFQSLNGFIKVEFFLGVCVSFNDFHNLCIKLKLIDFINYFEFECSFFSQNIVFPISKLKIGFVNFYITQVVWNSIFLDF